MAKVTKKVTKKRVKKNVERGQAHIQSSFNNTIVTLTDTERAFPSVSVNVTIVSVNVTIQ